ncbi:50S ribosomal protein L5, chloroplastic [Salvia divinorum]|uniref:50S ribosomal protein L5, chloroplastic n=1 Tax=Salvia divinorum TaxID=28513 RepID=A0ABD1H084_SALDI
MALSSALLHSTASVFHGHFFVRLSSLNSSGALSVKASTVVLVEKTEADKVNRLKTTYIEKIVPMLKEEFNYTNVHQVPKVQKIVIREGQPLGIACTLRGSVMYSFLDRLINLGLPRTRDFQGVSANSFDGNGNYNIGFREQTVFPELSFDILGKPRGMDVCIETTANTDKEAHRLLALMGMPFRDGVGGGGPPTTVRKKKLKAHHFNSKSKSRSKQKTKKR